MRAKLERAGIVIVNTLDEMLDASELLARYPRPKRGGLGVVTFSGAFCGIAHDLCEDIGVPVPPLSPEIEAHLKPLVPSFIPPKNPLDLGTQPLWQPDIVEAGVAALLKDPAIGGVAISIPAGAPACQCLSQAHHRRKADEREAIGARDARRCLAAAAGLHPDGAREQDRAVAFLGSHAARHGACDRARQS
jgi:acyl-CoA synthetase (NDP forming)